MPSGILWKLLEARVCLGMGVSEKGGVIFFIFKLRKLYTPDIYENTLATIRKSKALILVIPNIKKKNYKSRFWQDKNVPNKSSDVTSFFLISDMSLCNWYTYNIISIWGRVVCGKVMLFSSWINMMNQLFMGFMHQCFSSFREWLVMDRMWRPSSTNMILLFFFFPTFPFSFFRGIHANPALQIG